MKILYAASEILPFASTGGLADISGALPLSMTRRGVESIRVMPLYRKVAEGGFKLKDTGVRVDIPVGFKSYKAEFWIKEDPVCPTYFVRRDEFFDRSQLYSLPERDYDDNFERFVFFQKAIVAMIDALALKPDVVHCSDWQTGLLPLYLRYGIHGMGRNMTERTVFTIHNVAYQGIFPGSQYSLTNLPFQCFSVDVLEFYGNVNCLKAGMTTANLVTTVSKTYAEEIRTAEYGCGLHGVLAQLGGRLVGIINGADYSTWEPSKDPCLAESYSAENLSGKKACKEDLIRSVGLTCNTNTPILGMVTRLVDQKGLDILAEAMPQLMQMNLAIVVLGVGQDKYQELCKSWAEKWPGRFVIQLAYDLPLSHKIEGGADLFLLPSKFEPCGLSQFYSMRYGTIPIVHATGGLEDTVEDISQDGLTGTGFKFKTYTAQALLNAVVRALQMYAKSDLWVTVMDRAMRKDFSWDRASDEYQLLYKRLFS